jgi:hypothetical protein
VNANPIAVGTTKNTKDKRSKHLPDQLQCLLHDTCFNAQKIPVHPVKPGGAYINKMVKELKWIVREG